MINRRSFVAGVAPLIISAGAFAKTPPGGRLRAWAMATAPGGGGLPPDYPLDHTSVSGVQTGKQWGCFGRTSDDPTAHARIIAEADGDELWADAIGGPDGTAGIELNVTGACQQCSNRFLLPAGIDVNAAHGAEITIPLFGRYGFGIPDLINRIKSGAYQVNKSFPKRISDKMVQNVLKRIEYNNTHEWIVMERYFEQIFKPILGARWLQCKPDLSHVYLALFNYREALFSQYNKNHISKQQFTSRLYAAYTASIELVIEIVSPATMAHITSAPASVQADFVFNNH
jgi:hypothetical protein